MDVILKFAALRPHNSASRPDVSLNASSTFQNQLRALSSSPQPRKDAVALAQQFVTNAFLSQPAQVTRGDELFDLIKRLQSAPLPAVEAVATEVRRLIGTDPNTYLTDANFARDSVLARYLISTGPSSTVARSFVRIYAVADAVLHAGVSRHQLNAIVSGTIALPDFIPDLLAEAKPGPTEATPAETAEQLATQINTLGSTHNSLADTLTQLQYHAEDELDLSERGERKTLIDFYQTPSSDPAIAGNQPVPGQGDEAIVPPGKLPASPPAEIQPISPLLRAADRRNVIFSASTLDILPDRVKQTLTDLHLDVARNTLADIHDRVLLEHGDVGRQLRTLSGIRANLKGIAIKLPPIHFPQWDLDPVDDPEPPVAVTTTPPATHGEVKPLGVADLLLVRTHIASYEGSEVAYIENAVAHEKLTHEVRRLDRIETTTTAEAESIDLRSQAQSIAESDDSRTTVAAVGPGIGPIATESASGFAHSVTDQVSSSSSQRVRRVSELRQIHENEETLQHLIDNSTGTKSSYGVYQWLDKVYASQTFSYGSRLLYDIIVPEPAAVFREAIGRPRSGLGLPTRPAKFTLDPTKLDIDNWAYYVSGHHATGVDAPPAPQIIVTEQFAGKASDQFAMDAKTSTVIAAEARATRIPRGYRAMRYRVKVMASGFPAGNVSVSIGQKHFMIPGANGFYPKSGNLDKETETIPVCIDVTSNAADWGVYDFTIGVEIVCEATAETVSAWQVKAHGQILEANRRRFAEYEEAVANRDAAARIFLQSLTPARKATIVATEMKRAALEVLTAQNFSGFNANHVDPMGFPYPDPAAVTGLSAYIRFFEHAVEWDRLAYAFHPYFWGSQASWVGKLLAAESDRDFGRFLTSGAARVIVPIRPGFEDAFERYLHTGVTPTTDELLDVGGPLWVSLVNDLRDGDGAADSEKPVGDPWTFRVTSELVRARSDGSMPKWTLAQGAWKESADDAFS